MTDMLLIWAVAGTIALALVVDTIVLLDWLRRFFISLAAIDWRQR